MAGLQFCEKKRVLLFFRLLLNESREGFSRRGRGRSFHVDGPKTAKAREPTVESLVRGIWRLRVSEAGRSYCSYFLSAISLAKAVIRMGPWNKIGRPAYSR